MSWISVEDRLPEDNVEVLGYCESGIIQCKVYTNWKGERVGLESVEFPSQGCGCCAGDDGITHWQPLPEPPKD